MSATGRNLPGNERRPDDHYATPAWCVRAILPHLERDVKRVLDPCCGEGAILDAVAAYDPGITTMGVELNAELLAKCSDRHFRMQEDALKDTVQWPYPETDHYKPTGLCHVVTNPPYSLAIKFIQKAIDCRERYWDMSFLLRLNFLGGQKRAAFHKAHPCDVFVLPKRPSFTGHVTDATEYCWMVWGPGRGGCWRILDLP